MSRQRGARGGNSDHVVQIHITNAEVKDADAIFSRHDANGQPIVLVPDSPSLFCPAIAVTIPSGPYCLQQSWFNDVGPAPPGFKWFWCGWNRVSHIVSAKGISYNHPVADCPTSDNVMVRVDLSLNFQIMSVQDAQTFVYSLGATRLDEMLSAETEEAIRALVNTVPVMKVRDLKEEFTSAMKSGLNETMNQYGITIKNVKITDVALPPELDKTLQSRTQFETQMEQQEKTHEAMMRKMNDDAKQIFEQIKKTNKRAVQDLRAETERAVIAREEQLATVLNSKNVNTVDMKSQAEVAQIQANSKKSVSTAEAERHATEILLSTKAQADARKVESDQDYKSREVRSIAELNVASNEAKEIDEDADAEREAAKSLAALRDFEVQQLRMNVLTGLAATSNMVITGDTGDKVLEIIAPGGSMDMSTISGK